MTLLCLILHAVRAIVQYVAWKFYPGLKVNEDFADQVTKLFPDPQTPLMFICRSGIRSKDAAIEMTSKGYANCYNVLGGFEGNRDSGKHRATVNGWKVMGLPWVQR